MCSVVGVFFFSFFWVLQIAFFVCLGDFFSLIALLWPKAYLLGLDMFSIWSVWDIFPVCIVVIVEIPFLRRDSLVPFDEWVWRATVSQKHQRTALACSEDCAFWKVRNYAQVNFVYTPEELWPLVARLAGRLAILAFWPRGGGAGFILRDRFANCWKFPVFMK